MRVARRLPSRNLLLDVEIREAAELAHPFRTFLDQQKAAAPFDWYPWDSFGNLQIFDRILTGRNRWLRRLIGREPVLDIGCGDGALSFFLESLGARVQAVDYAPSNFNQMRGVKELKRRLASHISIAAADLDARPDLAIRPSGLALFLGVLYHLKNPFAVLETLASRARYCLLTTAITRFAPDQHTDVAHMPAAFLAGRDGLRGDETNYWIFTEPGLRNLIDRTGWDICDFQAVDDADSTLWGTQRDQRAFCLLRSRLRPTIETAQLGEGWHNLENNAWRWTRKRFSLWLPEAARVTLHCTVPPVIDRPITLAACGQQVHFSGPGDYSFTVSASAGDLVFEADHALPPDHQDGRERAIVIRAIDY